MVVVGKCVHHCTGAQTMDLGVRAQESASAKVLFDVLAEVRLTWSEEKRIVDRWPRICRRVANGTWGFSHWGSHMNRQLKFVCLEDRRG